MKNLGPVIKEDLKKHGATAIVEQRNKPVCDSAAGVFNATISDASEPPQMLINFRPTSIDELFEKDTVPSVLSLGDHAFIQRYLVGRRSFTFKLNFHAPDREPETTILQKACYYSVEHARTTSEAKDLWRISDDIRGHFGEGHDNRITQSVVFQTFTPASEYISQHPGALPVMADQLLQCKQSHMISVQFDSIIFAGIHDLRCKAFVLHRDISEGNIMFKLCDGGPCFILNDFDLAVRVNEDGSPKGNTSTHRTGTVPYMAVDLLLNLKEAKMAMARGEKPKGISHCVRFDYESVFWVSLGFGLKLLPANTPNRERKEQDQYELYLADWMNEDASAQKQVLLSFQKNLQSILSALSEPFRSLEDWFSSFQKPFRKGYAADESWTEKQKKMVKRRKTVSPVEKSFKEYETLFGRVTFETIKAALEDEELEDEE